MQKRARMLNIGVKVLECKYIIECKVLNFHSVAKKKKNEK